MLSNLTPQLAQVIYTASQLPVAEQNILAEALTDWLESLPRLYFDTDTSWDNLLAQPASQQWLEAMVQQVEADIACGTIFDFDPGNLPQ